MKLVIYTTLGCHLCEQVEEMLRQLSASIPHELESVEIADDDDLISQYALEIPVLWRPDINMDMAWPFTQDQLEQFLSL